MEFLKSLKPYQILFSSAPIFTLLLWNVETYIEFVNTAIKWDRGWIGIRIAGFLIFNGIVYWIFRDIFAVSKMNNFHLKWIYGTCILTTALMLYTKYFSIDLNTLSKPFILLMLGFFICLLLLILNLFFSYSRYYYNHK